jgi:hypothetical protein
MLVGIFWEGLAGVFWGVLAVIFGSAESGCYDPKLRQLEPMK